MTPALKRLRSQCYRLRLQEPELEMEALEARSCLPPELPAGKRGGWHRDSVYPKLRLTSFAPRALNFEAKFYRIDFRLDAFEVCRGLRRI